ncbi:hypothetical protein RRF57_010520 [Xylaria bambusicola]|uniref:Uncharacterized protein n=1 Tax=Xylaria bambusicola TaxID=326684 RepID=A0AAN7Z9J8_9PEZI
MQNTPPPELDIYTGDELGKIPLYYATADKVVKTLLKYESFLDNETFPPEVHSTRLIRLLNARDLRGNVALFPVVMTCTSDLKLWISKAGGLRSTPSRTTP